MFVCGSPQTTETQKALAKQAAVKLSDIKKSSFSQKKPDDKPTERWLKMSPAQKKAEAEREKQRRTKLERESGEKIEPYKAERLWEKEKHKYKDLLDGDQQQQAPPNQGNDNQQTLNDNNSTQQPDKPEDENKPEPAGPGVPKDKDKKKRRKPKQVKPPEPDKPMDAKTKKDSAKVSTDIKTDIDNLDEETKSGVIKTILDKSTTYTKNGKRYITKSAQVLGNINLTKLIAYSAGFALLGPFGAVLFHEALNAGEDLLNKPDDKDEKTSIEKAVGGTKEFIDSIIPKDYTLQQRDDIRNDFGRLPVKELCTKHKLDPDKLKDYLTFTEQIEKLKNSVPDKHGVYDIPLGTTHFKGTEEELKAYIEHLEDQAQSEEHIDYTKNKSKKSLDKDKQKKAVIADLGTLPIKDAIKKYNFTKEDMIKHYYITDSDLDKKIQSAKVDKYGKIRISINGVQLNDFPTKIKDLVKKYREDLFKVYDKQSANAVKEKLDEVRQREKDRNTNQGEKDPDYTETSISKQDQEALNLINNKPIDSGIKEETEDNTEPEEQKIVLTQEILEALPIRLRSKLKEVYDEAPEHLEPIILEEPEEQEEPEKTKYDEPKKEIKPVDDEEETIDTEQQMEKTLQSAVEYYIQRDPQKLRTYFEQKYPKLLNTDKKE